jgi:hypothetical protein
MFDPTSRYYPLETALYTDADGRQVPYKRRRFVPAADSLQIIGQVTVMQGDRLDLIAARTLGASEQFWQVCDANDAMNPVELISDDRIGTALAVALPQTPSA